MMTIGIWDAVVLTAKAATYAATLAASGGVFFLAYSHALLDGERTRRIVRLVRALACTGVLAGVAMIMAISASMSGDAGGLADTGLVRMILQAGEGRASLVRGIGLILIAASLTARRSPRAAAPAMGGARLELAPAGRGRLRAALFGSVAAATSFAWVGHAHSLAVLRHAWVPALAIVAHLLCAAFWLGALVPLLVVAGDADASRTGRSRTDMSRVAAIVRRFGSAALIVVAALLAAGVVMASLLLNNAGELWTDDYGGLLLTKILLVSCLLALAAFNHVRLTPRLLANDERALRALKRSIVGELVVAGCVLVVTAAMTTLTGPPVLHVPR